MARDQTVSADWGEAKRKRILRIVLGIIVGWNLFFIPLGIYLWPRLPPAVAAPARGESLDAQMSVRERVGVEEGESPPDDDPMTEEFNRLLSRFGSGAIDPGDVESLAAAARQALEESGAGFPIEALLSEIENLAGGGLRLTPESLRESVKRAEEAARQASNDEIAVSDIGFRVTERNDRSWRFAWHCSIVNKTKQARKVACYVKFLDEDGAVIDDGYKLSSFEAGSKQAVRGTAEIDLPHARRVVNVEVIASPR